jgi:hypothetical protein
MTRPKSDVARRAVQALLIAAAAALLLGAVVTILDWCTNRAIVTLHSRTPNATDTGEVRVLQRLVGGGTISRDDLDDVLAFVRERNDGSDFRLTTLLRAAYAYGHTFTPEVEEVLRAQIVGFRYGMDEPGGSAMVYWSENHQILFATAELLAGQRYPDARFSDGRTGAEHLRAAHERVSFWLEQRWRFGFSEWSSHYYGEDLAALANLIDFARDDELRRCATIVVDLLLLDMASATFRGAFVVASGRLYEKNKIAGDDGIRRILRHAFVAPVPVAEATGIEINFLASSYVTPAVLRAVAADPAAVVVRTSSGRDPVELDADASLSRGERRILALWGMQAFTNPEAIAASLDYIRAHGLFSNPYLAPFKRLNYRVLNAVGVLPRISAALDLPTNGTLLGRANVYTFRTADVEMSTVQSYRSGERGNQHHVFGVTLDDGLTLFHTHPAILPGDPPPNGNSPGYWTGTDILPLSCQDGGVNLSVYRLPEKTGYGRSYQLDYTHLHAPRLRFDRVIVEDRRLLALYRGALVAVTTAAPLETHGDDELIQRGRETAWVTEVASTRDETFDAFAERIRRATLIFDGAALIYRSGARTYSVAPAGCAVDGVPLETAYERHDSPYANVKRDPREVRVAHDGHSLLLDFAAARRESD